MLRRCFWVSKDPLDVHYHDHEWGVPIYDEQALFEFLILEGMQAGLSWLTILKKRNNFRNAFDNFDVKKMVKYDQRKIDKLLVNPGVIRHKLKIESAIINAKAFLKIREEIGSFSTYVWSFVENRPIQNHCRSGQIPITSLISDKLSMDLKKRGFKFVGSTICYSFMQAVGMVNDHTIDCFRYKQIKGIKNKQAS